MYCIDTDEMEAVMFAYPSVKHYEAVYIKDMEALQPILAGIRADGGNGDFTCSMHGGTITKRYKGVQLPDLSRKAS